MLYLNRILLKLLEKITNDSILFQYIDIPEERWLSGLKRLPAKQESG